MNTNVQATRTMSWADMVDEEEQLERSESQNTLVEVPILRESSPIGDAVDEDFKVVTRQNRPRRNAVYYKNRNIECNGCGASFEFTANKQLKYESLGWDAPKKCYACSQIKKQYNSSK
jgi:hypothetical protein